MKSRYHWRSMKDDVMSSERSKLSSPCKLWLRMIVVVIWCILLSYFCMKFYFIIKMWYWFLYHESSYVWDYPSIFDMHLNLSLHPDMTSNLTQNKKTHKNLTQHVQTGQPDTMHRSDAGHAKRHMTDLNLTRTRHLNSPARRTAPHSTVDSANRGEKSFFRGFNSGLFAM
jgi:hypothetical protein